MAGGNSENNGICNSSTGSVIVTGGAIRINGTSSERNNYGIYNTSMGSITVTGGTISCSSSAGSASKSSYGIYNASDGIVIIGKKDSDIVSKENPIIKGEYTGTLTYYGYGLYNKNGNIEFYNGVIQGNIALSGTISKIRNGYKIENSTIDGLENIYLGEKINEEYVVKIDDIHYNNLQDAIESIDENEEKTIQVIKDFEVVEQGKILFDKNIILDLNGYTVTNKYYKMENIGKLKITDTTENKEGKLECIDAVIGIQNTENGNIEIEAGTINCSGNNTNHVIYSDSNGNIKINGGTINTSGVKANYGIYNTSSGSVIINEGTINHNSSGSYQCSYGIYNQSNGHILIRGGTIYSNSYDSIGIYNNSEGGLIEINGGIINSNSTGTANGESNAIYNVSGSVRITGGTIISAAKMYSYGIFNTNNGNITVTGGTINSSSDYNRIYGIYNNGSGSITLGIKGDGIVSENVPHIIAKDTSTSTSSEVYGIYNINAKFYYYDGIIEGSAKAIYNTITEIEDETELNYNEDETIVTLSTTITDVAQIGEITYTSLQEAIEAVGSEQTTIKILRNVTYTAQDANINIPSTKNIKLDLNGFKITSSQIEQAIKNEGILEIIDTSQEQTGIIVTNEDVTIKNTNEAQLIINGGTIENRKQYCIYNQGEVRLMNGIISLKDSGTGIYNERNGSVTISGGAINSSNMYGIYNYGNITIGIKGDESIIQENPYIKGKTGIYNLSGNLNIYDGKIEGTTRAISGNITEIEDNTELLITKDTTEIIQLEQKETNAVSVNGTEYSSIEKAVKACGNTESTITVLRNVNPAETIIIEETQNITIDLNGFIVNNYPEITNKGTLKITDSSESQTGKIVGLIGTAIVNEGTMELQSGSISDSGYGINNKGTLTVNGGTITNNTYGIYNDTNGNVTISSGNITSNTYGIYNNTNGIITMSDGIITSNTYGIYNYTTTSTVNINGGTITSNQYGIYTYAGIVNISTTGITSNAYGIYNAGGTTNIKEGSQISSTTGIFNSKGTINIGETGTMNANSPIITGEEYGLVNALSATVYMYDGQIKGKTGATQGYVTYTETGYSVATKTEGEYMIDYLALSGTISTVAQVNGIDFSNLQSAINSVIGEEAQTVTLTNGIITTSTFTIAEGQNIILDMNGKTISSDLETTIINNGNLTIIDTSGKNVAKISSTVGTAISNSGTLTLGQDDGTITQDLINIDGTTYGIVNSGTLNFYDGTINGGSALSGTITNRATGYVIRITTVNSKERYYLST